MTRCVLGSCFSGQIPESDDSRQPAPHTTETPSRIWLRRGEIAFKKLWKRPVKQEDESEKKAELGPRSYEDPNINEDVSSSSRSATIDGGFSQVAGPTPTVAVEPNLSTPEMKAEPESTPPIAVEQDASTKFEATMKNTTPRPALIEESSGLPSHNSSESSSSSSSVSLKERLKAAKPLLTALLPQSGIRESFVDGYQLTGVDVAESLAEASSAHGGAQVQVNSEGAVFFLFFAFSADKEATEFVLVLKFTGTDIRTRSEFFANALAKGLGVTTPVTNLLVKGSNGEDDGWSGLRGAVDALPAKSSVVRRLLGELTRANCGLVMSFAPGGNLVEALGQPEHDDAAMKTMSGQIGRCLVLDLALRNSDRFPCSALGWRGNLGNVVLASEAAAPALVALDTTCPRAHPTTATRTDPETYQKVLRAALSDQQSASVLLQELCFDSARLSSNDSAVQGFIGGVCDGLRRLSVVVSALDESFGVVRKLLAGVTKEVTALQDAETRGGDENVLVCSSSTSTDSRSKSPVNRKISPSTSSPIKGVTTEGMMSKSTPTKSSPVSRTSPALRSSPLSRNSPASRNSSSARNSPAMRNSPPAKRMSPVLGTPPPVNKSSRIQSLYKTPTRRPPASAKKSATPGGQGGGDSKMALVRAVHEQYVSKKATPEAEAFVAKWHSKFASGALEIDNLLGAAFARADGNDNPENAEALNGFLHFGQPSVAANDVTENASDLSSAEGLVCVDNAFELHVRLKHLVSRAKLILETAQPFVSESAFVSESSPKGSTF